MGFEIIDYHAGKKGDLYVIRSPEEEYRAVLVNSKAYASEPIPLEEARKLIGSHYMVNFMIVPIMLISLYPWAGILMFFPFLGFIFNNLILHGTLLQPKTM